MRRGRERSGKLLPGGTRAWSAEPALRLVNPIPPLNAQLLGVSELARHAFGDPLKAGVLLHLRRGPWSPSRLGLFTELPWLQSVPEAEKVVEALLTKGWAVLKLDSVEEAVRLWKSGGSRMVRVTRLGYVC